MLKSLLGVVYLLGGLSGEITDQKATLISEQHNSILNVDINVDVSFTLEGENINVNYQLFLIDNDGESEVSSDIIYQNWTISDNDTENIVSTSITFYDGELNFQDSYIYINGYEYLLDEIFQSYPIIYLVEQVPFINIQLNIEKEEVIESFEELYQIYDNQYNNGYNNGYKIGYDQGLNLHEELIRQEIYDEAFQEGLKQGLLTGDYATAYEEGVRYGQTHQAEDIFMFLQSIANGFKGILDIQFGFLTIGDIALIPIILLILNAFLTLIR